MSSEFLLEIGCEEVPAWMLSPARASLQELLESELSSCNLLLDKRIETFATPRRLVAYCPRLAPAEPDRMRQAIGPPKSVAYDSQGQPTHAAKSFAAKQGIAVTHLTEVETPKGKYVSATTRQKGRPTRVVLAEILPRVIGQIEFPRRMYWTSPKGMRFIRPIRWVVALWAGRLVPLTLEGVRAGRVTYGHRLLGSKPLRVRGFTDYQRSLRRALVLVDPAERRRKILADSDRLLKRRRLCRRADNELLDLLVNSVEYPTVILGEFAEEFLALPAPILVTVMRHQQKYFPVENRKDELVNFFLAVIDSDQDRTGGIRQRHQAVLAARFRDAQFFWKADQKLLLRDRLPLLEQTIFQERLGSYRNKVERLGSLVRWMAANSSADGRRADIDALARAAILCKADLTTEMVREFPELQGTVGGLYAREQGESEVVSQAISDHYRPAGPEDPLPANLEACLLSVADKRDTVAGCFAVGLAPSGSRDPYALRRAAAGIVRIITAGGLRLPLRSAIQEAVRILRQTGIKVADDSRLVESIENFLAERARHLFRETRKFPYDEVNAAFAAGWDDLVDVGARLEAIRRIRPTPDFEPIAVAFKRIRNILEQAGDGERRAERPIDSHLLEPGAERDLYDRFTELRPQVAELRKQHRYEEALRLIASLRPQVDRYFDTVLVMANDEALRENRLTLLAQLLREFSSVADFSEIVVQPKEKP